MNIIGERIGNSLPLFMATIISFIAVCGLVVLVSVRNVTIHYDRISCQSFSDQAGRETKFVSYTYWKWDCLTPSGDGKWISIDNLREFGDQP